MKRFILSLATIAIFSLFIVSCYYDNEESLYPTYNTTCDTSIVTFTGTIVPILSNSCYACHSNATATTAGNNIRLQDYADVQVRAASIAGSIKHTGTFSPMPKNGGSIKTCSISQFDIWVRNGMINN